MGASAPAPYAKITTAKLSPQRKAAENMILADMKESRKRGKDLFSGNKAGTYAFLGLNPNASPEEYARARAAARNEIYQGPTQTTTQTAAHGGIMNARGFANGGSLPGLDASQKAFVLEMSKLMNQGKTLTTAQQERLNRIETKTGRDVSPYTNTGTQTPGDPAIAKAAMAIQTAYKNNTVPPSNTGVNNNQFNGSDLLLKTPGMKLDPVTGNIVYTDPAAIAAQNAIMNNQMPSQFQQASDMYGQTYQGLQNLTNYRPQNVTASQMGPIADVSYQNAVAERASAQQASAERATAAQMAAIRDINAERVNLDQYNVKASQMTQPKDVQAQALQRYQMGETAPVTTKDLEAYQMAGPGSWTDEGVSSKYMSPYMQGVVDISKREAERDYQKQVNALNAKSISAGAFGGARQAMERSEGQRNYNQLLADLETKGMQSAYESGRAQYGQELGLSQQAALQNLQAKLSTQSQSSQEKLQAMLSNQSIDYQTKLQNLQAMLGVQGQEAQMMLNAALANQQTAFGTGQTNAQLSQQAALANQGVSAQGALANQSAALQAALANQQTQFGVGSLNANLLNQTNLQNAQLGTQVSMTNAQLGTQAALQNAQLGTQVNLANSQYGLQAAMANQQMQYGVGSLNANLAQQANLANQQAGIAGAGINLNAYGQQQNAAQGVLGAGSQIGAYNQQQIQNLGNLANTNLGYGANIAATNQSNALGMNFGWQNMMPNISANPAQTSEIPVG